MRGYGGAMGGGKSRALCEDVFQDALDHPGIQIPIFRQEHVSVIKTTKRTMFTETVPPELLPYCKTKASGGEDYLELPNGSRIHFAGLDNPVRWFSSELGGVAFDEAHEIPEDSVVKLITRLRQRDTPRKIRIAFNPENPGHWLYRWFIAGAERTEHGYHKPDLYSTDAVRPIGAAEFIFARAADNPHLPDGYVEQELAGLPELLRRRYLDGEWLFVTGTCFFDQDALGDYETLRPLPLYRLDFRTVGHGQHARIRQDDNGRVRVYKAPDPDHRYAIGADVATGLGRDYSAAYVIDLATMEFVAEFRHKVDPDIFAEQLHFLGRWYNTALIAVESAGGFGMPVVIALRDGKSGREPYPRLYRHRLDSHVDLAITKTVGEYPMTSKTRPQVLNQLEKAIRDHDVPFLTDLMWGECQTFVYADTNPSPRAQEGCNDDCVMAAAITLEMYRQKGRHPDREKRLAGRTKLRRRRPQTWYERLHPSPTVVTIDEDRYRK